MRIVPRLVLIGLRVSIEGSGTFNSPAGRGAATRKCCSKARSQSMRSSFSAAAFALRQNVVHSVAGISPEPTMNTLSFCASPAPPSALSARSSTSEGCVETIVFNAAGSVTPSSRRSSSAIGDSVRFAAANGILWAFDFAKSMTIVSPSSAMMRPAPKPVWNTARPGGSEAIASNRSSASISGRDGSAIPDAASTFAASGSAAAGPCLMASTIAGR